jgi:hypothetical protein
MSAGTLRRILPPILDGNCNTNEKQRPEQRQDQKAPVSLVQIVIRVRGQKMQDISEGIGGHRRMLQESNSYATYRLMESLLCVRLTDKAHRGLADSGAS